MLVKESSIIAKKVDKKKLRCTEEGIYVPRIVCLCVMILSFRTDRSGQTVQTQIRLLLEEQSDQGLHCLLFHLQLFDEIP